MPCKPGEGEFHPQHSVSPTALCLSLTICSLGTRRGWAAVVLPVSFRAKSLEDEPCQVRDREREQQAPWTLPSKTKILPPLQFHSPFLILSRAGRGEVDDRVPLVRPDFWYKLSLALDLAVKSPFPTPLPLFLDLLKCQPPRLVQTPRSASAPALSPWSEQTHPHTHTPACAHTHTHTQHTRAHTAPFSLGGGRPGSVWRLRVGN